MNNSINIVKQVKYLDRRFTEVLNFAFKRFIEYFIYLYIQIFSLS